MDELHALLSWDECHSEPENWIGQPAYAERVFGMENAKSVNTPVTEGVGYILRGACDTSLENTLT